MVFSQEIQESLKEKNTEEEKREEVHSSQKDNILIIHLVGFFPTGKLSKVIIS